MNAKTNFRPKMLLHVAAIAGFAMTTLCSCNKNDVAAGRNYPTWAAANKSKTTTCTNPLEWIGVGHNEALAGAMSTSPKPANLDDVLTLAKSRVSLLTTDPEMRALIGSYPKASLIASSKLSKALNDGDEHTIAQYCTQEEAVLLKQLMAIANQNIEVAAAIEQVNEWSCGIQNNNAISAAVKDRMLATSAVMANSMEYWHQVLGGTTDTSRHWFLGDLAGGLIGFGFGGGIGAVVGAVAGSVLVGCMGWDVTFT